MHWLALIPGRSPASSERDSAEMPGSDPLLALGWWALQFTPRVCLLEEAVLMEVRASLRLFGGEKGLHERLSREAEGLGVKVWSQAPTGLAALALARNGVRDGFASPLDALLDPLPLAALSAVARHATLLSRLGCRTLGEVRCLPRVGLTRRLGTSVLEALDQAYGRQPEVRHWIALPEVFDVRLELPALVESVPALLPGVQRLLWQLGRWLAARQAGVRSFLLGWRHGDERADGAAGELLLRTAEATRDAGHLARLVAEHLRQVRLRAPVSELHLRANEVEPWAEANASLLPEACSKGEPLAQLVDRLAARLGATRVLWPQVRADHRPECQVRWLAAGEVEASGFDRLAAACRPEAPWTNLPQPVWLLEVPLQLVIRAGAPYYQGRLQLLAGPHRLEAGWWTECGPAGTTGRIERDYFIAFSAGAGLLWIYRERRAAVTGWFLQGLYG